MLTSYRFGASVCKHTSTHELAQNPCDRIIESAKTGERLEIIFYTTAANR